MVSIQILTRAGLQVGLEVRGHIEPRVCSFLSGILEFASKSILRNVSDISTVELENNPLARGNDLSFRMVITDADANREISKIMFSNLETHLRDLADRGNRAFDNRGNAVPVAIAFSEKEIA